MKVVKEAFMKSSEAEPELGCLPKSPKRTERLAEIREWIGVEREQYAEACKKAEESNGKEKWMLEIVRARVFFLAMRDMPTLLMWVDEAMKKPKPSKGVKNVRKTRRSS
jgi:hypothetical protein